MTQINPVKPQTLGQHLDAVLSAAGHDVSVGASTAETLGAKVWTWVKSEWHNLITAASTAYLALHSLGKL